MTTPATAAPGLLDRLCSVVAAAGDEDPVGSGGNIERLMALEVPTPWGDGLYEHNPDGSAWQQLQGLRAAYFDRLRAEHGGLPADGWANLNGIAPDAEWSVEGMRRAFVGLRPEAPGSQYALREYLLPADSEAIVELGRAFFEAPERLEEFEAYRVPGPVGRLVFVCTHGQVDICCARFGVPLYRQARAFPGVRAWRMTHFGGHRYAPTAWEFPSGQKWAFLDEADTERMLRRDGHGAELRRNLRGWSAIRPALQPLEAEGFARFGWAWLDYRRNVTVLHEDAEARTTRARLEFTAPDGTRGAIAATIAVRRDLELTGCGPAFEDGHGTIPEYELRDLEVLAV